MLHLSLCPACLPACLPACPQVYPAVKMDATKLIELLKPIRCGPRLPGSGLRCMWPCWLREGRMLHTLAPTACLTSSALRCPALPLPHCSCRDKDPREDLKTLARMYCTALEMQMRDKAR